MSTNLLSIESAFLSLPEVKRSLNLQAINTLRRADSNAQKKKFENSLQLAKAVKESFNWFSSEEGKAKFNEEGISWSNEEFFQKVFGWQKSFSYKLLKVGKLDDAIVENFNQKCIEVEARGEEAVRSIENLLKFAKQVEQGNEGGQEEGEGEGAEVETRSATIFTLAFKHPDKNISVRINEAGEIKTTNTTAEIFEAIKFLTDSLRSATTDEVGSCYECGGGFAS
jgi:hypothetical protein